MLFRLTLFAAAVGLALGATPARADGWEHGGWGHDHWGWHDWHGWHEGWHGDWHGDYHPWVYTPPPAVYYAPPPPAYYAPPPGVHFGFSWP